MLENAIKTRLADYRTSAVTATSDSYEPTLAVSLAPNTVYEIDCVFFVTGGTDGMRFILQYLGTFQNSYLTFNTTSSHNLLSVNSAIIYPSITGTEPIQIKGMFKTGSAERLRFSFRKHTDLSTDTTVEAGSFLIARPFT